MRRSFAALLFAWVAMAASASPQARFLAGIEDVPLAPGLEQTGPSVDVALAGGRILEATARGPVSPAAVLEFYRECLPALGWAPLPRAPNPQTADGHVFQRGRERLTIAFAPSAAGLGVRFLLLARAGPGS